jgi:hypothetical protein
VTPRPQPMNPHLNLRKRLNRDVGRRVTYASLTTKLLILNIPARLQTHNQ